MTTPLIASDQHWALWAVLLAAGAFGLWSERTAWGRRLSGAVVAIGTGFALSNLGVIPAGAPVYDTVWSYIVPLAIPLLLFRADLRRILRESGPTLIAFGLGAVGTVVGSVVAFLVVPLGAEAWKLAGIFCATYVGGSINYVAVAQALELRSGDLLSAGVAADNLVMTLYFLVLFALPSLGFLVRRFPRRPGLEDGGAEADAAPVVAPAGGEVRAFDLILALAVSGAACAVGFGVAAAIAVPAAGILVLTAVTVAAATLFPRVMGGIAGADRVGVVLLQVFFATIGATADVGMVLRVGPLLFVFAALILAVHLVFLLASGWLLRLDLRELVIASNANMGGPATAAAMAVARGWEGLVIPAILCGTLGYAVATFVGVGVGTLLR